MPQWCPLHTLTHTAVKLWVAPNGDPHMRDDPSQFQNDKDTEKGIYYNDFANMVIASVPTMAVLQAAHWIAGAAASGGGALGGNSVA